MLNGRPCSEHRLAGFTLLEIVVVLAVLMIVMVLAAPTMTTVLHRSKTAGFAQQIGLMLQQARFEAIKTGTPVTVALAGQTLTSTSGGETLASMSPPSRVRFEASRDFGGANAVSFQTDGSVDITGAFRIVDDWSNRMEIAIEPQATGRIENRKKNASGIYVTEGSGGAAWSFE